MSHIIHQFSNRFIIRKCKVYDIGINKKRDSMLVTVRKIDKKEGSLLQLERIYFPDPRLLGHKLARVL